MNKDTVYRIQVVYEVEIEQASNNEGAVRMACYRIPDEARAVHVSTRARFKRPAAPAAPVAADEAEGLIT